MKRAFYAAMALLILMTSCKREIDVFSDDTGITAYANIAQIDGESKSHGSYTYSIVWDDEDKIAVLGNGMKDTFTLVAGAGTADGTFQQDTPSRSLGSALTAFVPASLVDENNAYVWPQTQSDIESVSLAPMMATSHTEVGEDVKFNFRHLGAVLQLVLTAKNGEINVHSIDITADQNLSGTFTVADGVAVMSEPEGQPATITTGDITSRNIVLGASATYLNFAIPSGNYTNFTIVVTGDEGKRYTLRAPSFSLARAKVNKVTYALNCNEFNSFEVKVNGHNVRIVEALEVPDLEMVSKIYVNSDRVYVNTASTRGNGLACSITGDARVNKSLENGFYTFEISDINSDVIATLGYQHATGISLDKSFFGLEPGQSKTLVETVEPFDAYNKRVSWSSSSPEVATVDQYGKVSGVTQGTTTISATTEDGELVAECRVDIWDYLVKKLTLDREEVMAHLGWVVSLQAKILPAYASNQIIIWESDEPDVAQVDEFGNVHTLSEGKAVITATAADGSENVFACNLSVEAPLPYSLPYEFSVSETKRIHFSRGNLWYGPKGNQEASFHFEDAQHVTQADASSDIQWDENHVEHFWFSETAAGAVSLNNSYDDNSSFFTNQSDFVVEGNTNGTYFTLSPEEWRYLLEERTVAGDRFVRARVKGVRGILIYPDVYTGIISEHGIKSSGFPDEDIPDATWESMESSGCVFLPAAGLRSENEIFPQKRGCHYWTAKPFERWRGIEASINGSSYNFMECHLACSIRLVTETQSWYYQEEKQ